jgi:hypothetical protein
MVSKCANPECSVPFHYFREGKLFRIEAEGIAAAGPTLVRGKRPHRVEHYWLCGACSQKLTLAYDPAKGAIVTPLPKPAVRRAAAS